MFLLISPQKAATTKRLAEEAARLNFPLDLWDLQDLAKTGFGINVLNYQGVYIRQAYPYFEEVLSLARRFKAGGKRVVDASLTSEKETRFEKLADLQILLQNELPIPQTTLLNTEDEQAFPLMLKWNYGYGGHNVFIARDKPSLHSILFGHPRSEWLRQEYIEAEYEYKIVTVGFKSLPKILKFKYSGVSQRPDFGEFEVLDADQISLQANLAGQAAKLLGRELSKIDLLERDGRFYVLEVNRFPGLDIFENLTGYNAAGDFIKYLRGDLPN